ncbi:MAG TPA: M23 family metallopeptidase, partial [Polyangiaceae bacterium]|nr:M23 family metallopeptidase [Polyangiaceae bacterium]
PPTRTPGPSLSPNLLAGLIGLVGTTLVATLGLLLDKADTVAPSPPASVASAVATSAAPAAPAIAAPPRTRVAGPWRVMDDAEKPGNQVIRGRIGKQAFLRAIQDAGLPKAEAYRAYTALKGLLDLDHCKSSDEFLALVSRRGKTLLGFEYIISKEEVVQARPNAAGLLAGQKLDLKVVRNQVRRAFAHDGKSFEESARRAGFDPGIANLVGSALRGHSALSDFKAGDRMRIIVQEVTVLGEFSRYAGIEAMEILKAGQEPRRIYYYAHPLEGGHFDTTGRAPYEGGWRLPIPGAPVTSKFNMKRMHPVLHKPMPHTGTDFGAPTGTPIGATSPGVISFIGNGGPSGNLVKVKHEGGYESGYAHLSRFVEGLKVGDAVERMQTVGYCGTTGRSTGPHLHFTMKKDGVYLDPESLNLDGMRVISKSHREAFAEVRTKYDPILDAIPLPEAIAAAPAQPTLEPGSASDEEQDMEADLPAAAGPAPAPPATPPGPLPAQRAPAQPAAASPAPTPIAPPAQPAQVVAPSAIFLSDDQLLKMQSVRDPGEVQK